MKHLIIIGLLSVGMTALPGFRSPAGAQTGAESDVQMLREQVEALQATVGQLQQTIQTMQEQAASQVQPSTDEIAPDRAAAPPTRVATSPLDSALAELDAADTGTGQRALWRQSLGRNTQLRLIDISTDVLLYAGGSSERDASLSTLQGGAHDPKQRGFTLGQAEISLSGAVDPYFTGEAHLLTSVNPSSGETTFEIEEAFLTSSALPYGLQLEAGHMLTEFGILNPQHPHSWDWIDQPVVHSRMFGGDGLRQTGLRASWIAPTPWFSEFHFGVQNATGATMASFLGGELVHDHGAGGHGDEGHDDHGHEEDGHDEDGHDEDGHDEDGHDEDGHDEDGHEEDDHDEDGHDEDGHEGEEDEHAIEGHGIGGRPIVNQDIRGFGDFTYLARWEHAFDLSDELTAVFGASGLYGPNSTGRDGDTWLYGLDMKWRWTPADSFRGYPFLTWQTELIKRDYHAARYTTETEDGDVVSLPGNTLEDWGLYSQLLYGFQTGWAAGLRLEYAGGSGRGHNDGGRRMDPFRDDRYRVSPLLVWRPTEFSRIRLQYNFDSAAHLANDAHGVWLGFEWLYGAHPAHDF